jgi:hypothetical protein
MVFSLTLITSLNSINQLIFVIGKCSVFFTVWTEFLNIQMGFSFKGLNRIHAMKACHVFQLVYLFLFAFFPSKTMLLNDFPHTSEHPSKSILSFSFTRNLVIAGIDTPEHENYAW